MIPCKKLLSELSNILDEDVDPALRSELEIHLKKCPDCWATYDTTRQTLLIFRGNDPYPMPDDVKIRLSAAIRQKLEQKGCK